MSSFFFVGVLSKCHALCLNLGYVKRKRLALFVVQIKFKMSHLLLVYKVKF